MFGMRQRWVLRSMAALGFGVMLSSATPVWAQGAAGGGAGGGLGGGAGGGAGGGLGGAGGGLGGAGRGGAGGAGGAGGGAGGGGSNSITSGGIGSGGAGGGSATDQTNFLTPTFSNPVYMGRYSAPSTTKVGSSSGLGSGSGGSSSATASNSNLNGIGGFGQPSLGTSGGSNNRLGGSAGVNRGGAGAGAGALNSSSQMGQMQYPTQISFSASLKFAPTVKPAAEVEAELRNILGRSTSLSNPNGIQVTVADKVATLRGKVASADERSLAEGLIRLAPGVRGVRNELEAQ